MVMEVETISAGADVVDFSSIVLTANANNVTGFDKTADKLQFNKSTFSGIAASAGSSVVITDVAGKNGTNEIYVDTAANIVGLTSGGASKSIAIVTTANSTYKSGDIIYDADGNFSSDAVVIGNIGTVAAGDLTSANFVVVA